MCKDGSDIHGFDKVTLAFFRVEDFVIVNTVLMLYFGPKKGDTFT